MLQNGNGQLPALPVVFPEAILIIKCPCLCYICQGNIDLGALYRVGGEAELSPVFIVNADETSAVQNPVGARFYRAQIHP